jgi:hypothetical protein
MTSPAAVLLKPQNVAEAYSVLSTGPLVFADPVQSAAVELLSVHAQCLEIAAILPLECDQCVGTGTLDDVHSCLRCHGAGRLHIDRDYLDSLNLPELRMVLAYLNNLQESVDG